MRSAVILFPVARWPDGFRIGADSRTAATVEPRFATHAAAANRSARSLAGHRSYLIALVYDNPSANYVMEVASGVLSPNLRRYTENAIARIRVSPEGQEGLNAFLEKRTPTWQEQ